MHAKPPRCARCGARLAGDNKSAICRPCQRATREALRSPPTVPPEFWENEQLRNSLIRERNIGHAIRGYRHHPYHGPRQIPQEIVASWLGISQVQLARIERGRPVEDLGRLIQWATVLAIPAELLWFALPDDEHHSDVAIAVRLETQPPAIPAEFLDLRQVELLRQEMTDALGGGTMGDASLDDWERIAIRYARATRDRAADLLLGDISRDLGELNRLIGRQRAVSSFRRLTRVSAQMSGLMCLVFCILDDRSSFRAWARTAGLAGNSTDDPEILSWIYAQEAYGHYYGGDISEAIDVAQRAYEVVSYPCTGAALASALEARAQAILGRSAETREALARAEEILSRLEGEVLIPSAFGYNESSFRFHEGNAYTHLRDVKSAMRAQERALELCAPDNYTDWAMTRLDRAQCLIYSGDLTSGLEYATETIGELARAQRKGIITLRAKEIIGALPRDRKSLVAARDLREILDSSERDNEVDS